MNRSIFRLLPALRALFALMLVLGLPAVAMAQDGEGGGGGNVFVFIFMSVGLFWIVLAPLSFALVVVVVLLALDLRMAQAIPAGFVDDFTDTVNKRKFKEAYEMAKTDPSYLGQVLTAGMARLQYGLEDAREASLNTLEALKSDKEQKNNYTATIATLGPLLGLVGTVFGMILSFMVLASGTNINGPKLAEGIAHALSVTLIGVAISCPAIAFNTYFRNRITQLMLQVGNVADDLLTQMYHNSKKPAGPGGPPTVTAGPVAAAPVAPRA